MILGIRVIRGKGRGGKLRKKRGIRLKEFREFVSLRVGARETAGWENGKAV